MRVKINYCKDSSDGFFAIIMIPVVSTKILFVGGSGILYEKETLKLCTPKSYMLSFIISTRKLLNKNTVLKIIEEQLKNGTDLGRSCLDITDNIEHSKYMCFDEISVRKEVIELDESEVVDMINRYIQEEEEW